MNTSDFKLLTEPNTSRCIISTKRGTTVSACCLNFQWNCTLKRLWMAELQSSVT